MIVEHRKENGRFEILVFGRNCPKLHRLFHIRK